MHSSAYDIVALRDDVLPVEQLGAFLPLQTPMQPFRVVASKSRSFSASALTDEVETAGCCHPTCKNVGGTSVQSRCSVDSCSAVVVPAPGDEVSPEICELSGVALSLLQKLCARRNYTLQDEVLVQFTSSATVMNAANLETAAPTGNATSQMLVSGMCEMDREVLALTPVSVLYLDVMPSRSWVAAAFYGGA
jgi:hypothetical protein